MSRILYPPFRCGTNTYTFCFIQYTLISLSQMGLMSLFTYLNLLLGPTFYIHWAKPYTLDSVLGCGSDHIYLGLKLTMSSISSF